ncbi:hypothetical protein HPB49_003603 [Dermacentor silvarum]|uniref:Uncharacterized protein n=1 Tax=Dermacentor silvarum TaxID=543639 RepID=A0ACB8D2K2_DERSI|nr:hypothetical protein HPB49_003603 [Dermacentor silvarum]
MYAFYFEIFYRRPRSEGAKKVQEPSHQLSDSLRHALRLFKMPGFYVLLVTAVAGDYAAVEFGMTIVDYGLDKAIKLDKAQQLTTFLFSGELAGRLVIPLLADVLSFGRRPLYAVSFLCMFTCMTALPHVSNFPGVVSLCVAQGIAQGYGLCIKYVLVADFLGIERTAVCFGMYGVAMAPLSLVSPRIIGSFRDAKGSYDGFYQTLGAETEEPTDKKKEEPDAEARDAGGPGWTRKRWLSRDSSSTSKSISKSRSASKTRQAPETKKKQQKFITKKEEDSKVNWKADVFSAYPTAPKNTNTQNDEVNELRQTIETLRAENAELGQKLNELIDELNALRIGQTNSNSQTDETQWATIGR